MFKLFKNRRSQAWHKKVQAAAASGFLSEDATGFHDAYLWAELRSCTDDYLDPKDVSNAEEADCHLQLLIQEHPDTVNAIAACAHRLSSQSLRHLLKIELSTIASGRVSAVSLRAIIVAKLACPAIISDHDEDWAHTLRPLADQDLDTYRNALIPRLLSTDLPKDALFLDPLHGLTIHLCRKLANELSLVKLRNEWFAAAKKANCLALAYEGVKGTALEVRTTQVLDQAFLTQTATAWKSWALWKPDAARLQSWESFTEEQAVGLKPVMALAGPDFKTSKHTSLKEAVINDYQTFSAAGVPQPNRSSRILRFEGIVVRLETGDIEEVQLSLEHLLRLVDNVRVLGQTLVNILIRTIWKEVTPQSLRILDHLIQIADDKVTAAVRGLFVSLDCRLLGNAICVESDVLRNILLVLEPEERRCLREDLALSVLELAQPCLSQKQAEFRQMLQTNPDTVYETDLHKMGYLLRQTAWLIPLFEVETQNLLIDWPSESDMQTLQILRHESQALALKDLQKQIDDVCLSLMVDSNATPNAVQILTMELCQCWNLDDNRNRRYLALAIATFPEHKDETHVRVRCLRNLHMVPVQYYNQLRNIFCAFLQGTELARAKSCILFAKMLAQRLSLAEDGHWALILRIMISKGTTTIMDSLLTTFTLSEYFEFVSDIGAIFPEELETVSSKAHDTWLLSQSLHVWCQKLSRYAGVLSEFVGHGDAATCLLTGGNCIDHHQWLEQMLEVIINDSDSGLRRSLMLTFIGRLDRNGENSKDISRIVVGLAFSSNNGVQAISDFLEYQSKKMPKPLLEAFLMGWLSDPGLNLVNDRPTLKGAANLLDYSLEVDRDPPGAFPRSEALEAADKYIQEQLNELLAEASRLNDLRLSLKVVDSAKTTRILESVGIADPSPAEDAIALLPNSLVDVIDKVGDYEVEMHFSLSCMKPLTKTAMGVGNVQSLQIRFLFPNSGLPAGFCVHINDDSTSDGTAQHGEHSYWLMIEDSTYPEQHHCYGNPTRLTFQVSRCIFRSLHEEGFTSIETLYTLISDTIRDLTSSCMVCGFGLGARLKRSIVCDNKACERIYANLEQEIRLGPIRTEGMAFDLLLSATYAAATSAKKDLLLPACPQALAEVPKCINQLPLAVTMQASRSTTGLLNLFQINRVHTNVINTLLPWIESSFRGYLIAATVKIPSCPNITQFVLCSSHPTLESSFSRHTIPQGGTKVLFHGTSLERLYPILTQGLRVQSGTALQVHGAARGNGIYAAEEPLAAESYARATAVNWSGSQFRNFKILLGCEYVGKDVPNAGVYVVQDFTTIMVRYVFLLHQGAQSPHARHIVPAMLGAFSTLRVS